MTITAVYTEILTDPVRRRCGVTSRGIEILAEGECRLLLGQRSLGRVGVKLGDDIVVLPVYYALHEGDIVFCTDPGTSRAAGS